MRVVESKVTPGLPSAVATGHMRQRSVRTVFGPVKESSARVSSDAGDRKERTGSCAGIGVAFVQAGRKDRRREAAGTVDGGKVADSSWNFAN